MRKPVLVSAIALGLLVTGSLNFLAGRVTSPQQRAAQAAAPPVTAATANAQLRVLDASVVGRATVVYERPVTVSLSTAEGPDVVTQAPLHKGDTVKSGDVLLEVASHPVVAVTAPFSPYRDLYAGDSGRDTSVLKRALVNIGYTMSVGDRLSSADMSRIKRMLKERGYDLPKAQSPVSEAPKSDATSAGSTKPESAAGAAAPLLEYLPAAWWVGVSRLPASVASVGPAVGQHLASSPTPLALTLSDPALKVTLPRGNGARPAPGAKVTFEVEGGSQYIWTVKSASTTATAATGGDAAPENDPSLILSMREPVSASLVDAFGKVTFGPASEGKVLAVPLTAISSAPSGDIVVRVLSRLGTPAVAVKVKLGEQAGGWVQVISSNDALKPGVVVVLG